jgi:phage shock protein E
MKNNLTKTFALPASAILFALMLTGCAGESTTTNMGTSAQNQPTNSTVDRSQNNNLGYTAIIDVRTLEEWNEGHLEGAVRIGIESPDFFDALQELDKSKDYYVYCRSGNRAEQAIQIMRESGFTGDLVNGGAVADAAAELNLPVIK